MKVYIVSIDVFTKYEVYTKSYVSILGLSSNATAIQDMRNVSGGIIYYVELCEDCICPALDAGIQGKLVTIKFKVLDVIKNNSFTEEKVVPKTPISIASLESGAVITLPKDGNWTFTLSNGFPSSGSTSSNLNT